MDFDQRLLLRLCAWRVSEPLRQVLECMGNGSMDTKEMVQQLQFAAEQAKLLESILAGFFPNDPLLW